MKNPKFIISFGECSQPFIHMKEHFSKEKITPYKIPKGMLPDYDYYKSQAKSHILSWFDNYQGFSSDWQGVTEKRVTVIVTTIEDNPKTFTFKFVISPEITVELFIDEE